MSCWYGSSAGAVDIQRGRRDIEVEMELYDGGPTATIDDSVCIKRAMIRTDDTPSAPGSGGRKGTAWNGHFSLSPTTLTEPERIEAVRRFLFELAKRGAKHDPRATPTRVGTLDEWHKDHADHAVRVTGGCGNGVGAFGNLFDSSTITCACGRLFESRGHPWGWPFP